MNLTARRCWDGRCGSQIQCWDSCRGIGQVARHESSRDRLGRVLRVVSVQILVMSTAYLTLFWALETDKELLPVRYVNDLCLQ